MAAGRKRVAWDQTASLMATIVNANPFRDAKAKLAQPRDFHPDHAAERAEADKPLVVPLSVLVPLLVAKT
ncbi:MAG: hypothetical protein JWO31_887 [Phycisphaerales bacterium]|nr:hypothetical protein [Phycisphaerales bacterium]